MNGKRKRKKKKNGGWPECERCSCYGFVGSVLTVRVRSVYAVSSLSLLLLLAPLTLTLGHSVIASRTMNRFDIPCLVGARERSRLIYGARVYSSYGSSLSLSLSFYYVPYVAALISTGTWTTKLPIATRSEFSSYEDLQPCLRSVDGFCSFLVR